MAIAAPESGGPMATLIVVRGRERECFEPLTQEFATDLDSGAERKNLSISSLVAASSIRTAERKAWRTACGELRSVRF
jgi:hypothetical protein